MVLPKKTKLLLLDKCVCCIVEAVDMCWNLDDSDFFCKYLVSPPSGLNASDSNEIYLQSACWAIAKSWLDFQVDYELTHLQPERMDQIKSIADAIDGSPAHSDGAVQTSSGSGSWPLQVSNQQPRQLSDLIQKLHSGYIFLLQISLL